MKSSLLLGSRSWRNSALTGGTTGSRAPVMICTGVSIVGQQVAQHRQLLRVGLHVAHRLGETLAGVGGEVVLPGGVGGPIPLERSRSRPRRSAVRRSCDRARGSGASTHSFSGSPSWSGTAVPPVPTTRLRNRPGYSAAAKSDAAVPTSGPTRCGCSSPNASAARTMNSPIAFGDINDSRRSDCPNPGRSIATRWVCSANRVQSARRQ